MGYLNVDVQERRTDEDSQEPAELTYLEGCFYGLSKWMLRRMPLRLFRELLSTCRDLHSDNATDVAVLICFLASLVSMLVCRMSEGQGRGWLLLPILVLPAWRMLEILNIHAELTLTGWYRARESRRRHSVRSYQRSTLLVSLNFLETVFWFAFAYINVAPGIATDEGKPLPDAFEALNYSWSVMTTFGQTEYAPTLPVAKVIVLIQSVVGVFMVVMVLTNLISWLPKPPLERPWERNLYHLMTPKKPVAGAKRPPTVDADESTPSAPGGGAL